MKLILIRKAETDEDLSRAEDVRRADAGAYRVYAGTDEAALKTAEFLFDLPGQPERTPLLDDVPLPPLRDGDPRPACLIAAVIVRMYHTDSRVSLSQRLCALERFIGRPIIHEDYSFYPTPSFLNAPYAGIKHRLAIINRNNY